MSDQFFNNGSNENENKVNNEVPVENTNRYGGDFRPESQSVNSGNSEPAVGESDPGSQSVQNEYPLFHTEFIPDEQSAAKTSEPDVVREIKPVYYIGEGDIKTKKPKKKNRLVSRVVAAVLLLSIFIGGAGFLISQYDINIGGEDTLLSISKKSEQKPEEPGVVSILPSESPGQSTGGGVALNIADTPKATPLNTSGELTIAEIAAKVTPSTVGIISYIDSLYGTSTATGTGIVMTSDGYIITNHHVIDGAKQVVVEMMDGTQYDATIIGSDQRSDLAVLKVNAAGLTPAEFGDSDKLVVGELAVAIGNPLGLELKGTVTSGIISAINRDVIVDERKMTLIQTDAAINSGNSGGPLINRYGQIVGINTLKMRDYYSSIEGLGFAIPTNTVKLIVDELIENGYIKGWPAIGIGCNDISAYIARYNNVPQGVIVQAIYNESAMNAGLQPGDIITGAQGQKIVSQSELNAIKEEFSAGDEFTITVYRRSSGGSGQGQYIDITFNLMDEADMNTSSDPLLIP